ncbi:MAG TPA: asparagine synthase (glutamine-hydrolyzing) [Kofleriaceae bacterium]|nr:asparagine synthase (glutamine-hydrolyzing) [Kofleriaceae bacterium]
MCGIVSIFSRSNSVSEATLVAATEILHHRGPDGRKHWISPTRRVGLGHTRLSIIDLATGDQPLASEDGQIHAVVNGEFYDHVRIRGELEERGHRFATRSDSEILIHLYQERGASCIHELRGEFAFVLWDETSQTLLAGRDRFGIKPLYHARHKDMLVLASEVKALFAAGVPARWDHESVFQFNNFVTFEQDRTAFEGVHQVPPGHFLRATANHTQLVRYWDFDYPDAVETATAAARDAREHIEEFHAVLDEAVRLRLQADVPVGCYLSGGLDSCAVLGLASRHVAQPIRAFTLSFDHADYDELPIAREMAEHAGAELTPIAIRHEDLADSFADAIWHSETLSFNAHGIAKFLLSRAVQRAGYKVVLTGEGSDEIVAGYPHFRRDLVLHGGRAAGEDVEKLLAQLNQSNKVSSGLLLPHGKTHKLDGVRAVLGFVPSWMEAFSTIGARFAPLFSKSFAAAYAGRDALRAIVDGLDVRTQLTGRDVVNQSMYTWSKTFLPNYILNVLGDRMEMAHSIEGRVPFLDHHVVEVARRLPISMKIHEMTEKYVLREATRPVLSDTVYRRQKHPFLAPPATLNPNGKMHQLLNDTLRGSRLAQLPFYDRAAVVQLLDEAPAMDPLSQAAVDNVFSGILSACFLQEKFGLAA